MKFLIDECLHTSLVAVAQDHGHDCFHVNWLGLSGETDWDLMPRIVAGDFTFVTNNARDFRKLYAKEELHAAWSSSFLRCCRHCSGNCSWLLCKSSPTPRRS
ncbi:DUF5615 family PIN-like protein [Rhizobium sp. YTUHZ044]|uniref:DUF5615 family PIN-like protein n=1 Tax=Rhizobium sp. YTUHZ044 TaxID=2962678 RepID=UPI003DA7EFEB